MVKIKQRICLHCKEVFDFLPIEIIDGKPKKLNAEEKKYCPYCRAVLLSRPTNKGIITIGHKLDDDERHELRRRGLRIK